MPSLTTIYRAIVMIVAGVIVVKGWQLYGPTAEQVKSFGVRAIEMAQVALSNEQPTEAEPTARNDPRLAAAPRTALATASVVEPAPLFSGLVGTDEGVATPLAAQVGNISLLPAGVADRLPPLYSRLEELGASDPQLRPWGSSGQMYRFCCRAALAGAPSVARHFEAVAAEPIAAVEQVVASVESWRVSHRDRVALP